MKIAEKSAESHPFRALRGRGNPQSEAEAEWISIAAITFGMGQGL